MTHPHGGDGPLLVLVVLVVGYEALTLRPARGRPWNPWRATSFMTGCALLALALAPGRSPDFPTHVGQHLVVGMLAPTALVLGAPVTLVLRTLPAAAARRLVGILHRRPVRLLTHPVSALVLSSGTLAVLHTTPLYSRVVTQPGLHDLVLVHFLLSGWLFAWVIAGPDPAPRRPSVRYRLVVLGVAVLTHAVLSQLLYAGVIGDPGIADADRRAGATLLYYGADAAEVLLAVAIAAVPVRRRLAHGPPRRRVRRRPGTRCSFP